MRFIPALTQDRLHEVTSSSAGRTKQQLYPITVSIGMYEARPDPADELPAALWRAIDAADQALYTAKNTGRNRVGIAAP